MSHCLTLREYWLPCRLYSLLVGPHLSLHQVSLCFTAQQLWQHVWQHLTFTLSRGEQEEEDESMQLLFFQPEWWCMMSLCSASCCCLSEPSQTAAAMLEGERRTGLGSRPTFEPTILQVVVYTFRAQPQGIFLEDFVLTLLSRVNILMFLWSCQNQGFGIAIFSWFCVIASCFQFSCSSNAAHLLCFCLLRKLGLLNGVRGMWYERNRGWTKERDVKKEEGNIDNTSRDFKSILLNNMSSWFMYIEQVIYRFLVTPKTLIRLVCRTKPVLG